MNFTITVDWLELLCSGTIYQIKNVTDSERTLSINEDIVLAKNESKFNPRFYLTYDILYQGNLFGCLYYKVKPKYRFELEDSMILSVENFRLYEKGYSEKLNLIIRALKIQFVKYNELHIAVDGLDLIKTHNKLVKSTQIKRQKKIKVNPEFDEQTKVNLSYILGSRSSDKYIAIYPKEDFLDKEYKPYIRDFWEHNKLKSSGGQRIDRLEIRYKKAKQLTDFDNDFSKLESPAYLASFFKTHGGVFISFSYKKSKRQISLIDWSVFGSVAIEKIIKVNHIPVKISTLTTIKTLILEFRNTNKKTFLNAAVELSNDKQLNDTVAKKVIRWLNDR